MHRNDRNALVLCRWDRSHIYSPSGGHFPSLIRSHNPDSDPFHSSSGHVNKSTRWRKYCGCPANMILRLASRDYNAHIFRSGHINSRTSREFCRKTMTAPESIGPDAILSRISKNQIVPWLSEIMKNYGISFMLLRRLKIR